MEVINGVLLHAVGASSASLCYTPEKKVQRWSWQTYWLAQASVCWLILPFLVAWLTIPHLGSVLQEAPSSSMINAFLLGIAYGVGGTAFGIAIRYVGFSLTYAIAVGLSCVIGTLLPPAVNGELGSILARPGASLLMWGVLMGTIGIAFCGVAGRSKEKDIARKESQQLTVDELGNKNSIEKQFSLAKGLPLCLLAGMLSALYGFSLDQANPIADVAAKYGAGQFQENVKYLFSNTGAFVCTALYCLYLHNKNKTFGEFANAQKSLGMNYLLAFITGCLWYGQFFFYGLGHVRMGTYKFSSWAIHMIMLVLFSSVAGILLKEWKMASSKTIRLLALALLILLGAVLVLTYGNYLGSS